MPLTFLFHYYYCYIFLTIEVCLFSILTVPGSQDIESGLKVSRGCTVERIGPRCPVSVRSLRGALYLYLVTPTARHKSVFAEAPCICP